MIIESVTLRNFRQYYGEQVIEFSQSNNRNVTVIHGENGSGKTALLNAFSWCLYGFLNLPNESNIINEHAINEAEMNSDIDAEIAIKFIVKTKEAQDQLKKYTITRTVKAKKMQNGISYFPSDVKLEYKENGRSVLEINNVTSEINRILPEQLSSYFFFDGERIDNLSKDEGTEEVKDAIKIMMGLEILERSISHTDNARKKFLTELKKYADTQTLNLIEEIEKLQKEKEELKNEEAEEKKNYKLVEGQIKQVEERLRQIEDSKHLQAQRDSKTNELIDVVKNLKNVRKSLADVMSKSGHLAFSFIPVEKAEKMLSNTEVNKNNYTGIKTSFIEQLLDQKECICGTHLKEGSEEYGKILETKQLLAPVSLENAITSFRGDIKVIKDRKQKFFEDIDRLKKEEFTLIQQERLLNEEIEEISSKISERDSEEVVNLESKRDQSVKKRSDIDRRLGVIQHQLLEIEEKLDAKNKEREKINQKAEKAALTEKRIKVCDDIVVVMSEIYKLREKIVKELVQERVSKVYEKFLRKEYDIKLSNDYRLDVINRSGNKVGMSQGERQITSLSFIGAIVDIARDQFNKTSTSGFDEGGIYPIVMDSPFGALDSDHRKRIAKGIHELADQVVVIVSTSQWRGEVEQQMADKIGKEYKLVYNDPRINKDKPYEFTEIVEVIQ